MPSECCVPNCRFFNKAVPAGKPAFNLPTRLENKERWIEILQINQQIKGNSGVCWLHFNSDDYFTFSTTHRLKKNVLPLPVEGSVEVEVEASSSSIPDTSSQNKNKTKTKLCRPCRVGNVRSKFFIENFIKSDKKISYFTGIPTFKILITIFRYVLKSEKGSRGAVHQRSAIRRWNKPHQLSPLNEFFLTLMKLRHAFETDTLSVMFVISPSAVCKIFNSWINLLYMKLSQINIFPHRDAIIENSPTSFKKKYPNTIGSIDCTEIYIQTPSSLVRQSQCFSHYKGSTTLKALIMIEPCGGIMFVSSLFTGSISDKKIVEDSRFVELLKIKINKGSLKKGDIILADKGFEIQNILSDIGVIVNIPTFRLGGIQFEENEIEYIRKIAHERIHVERSIRRIKTYKILSTKIPITLLGSINQIFTVCALLTNFKMPLRKK